MKQLSFARVHSDPSNSLEDVADHLKNSLGENIVEQYYPVGASRGNWYGFLFLFDDTRIESWESVSYWCETTGYVDKRIDLLTLRHTVPSTASARDQLKLAEASASSGFHSNWFFRAGAGGKLTNATRYTIDLEIGGYKKAPVHLRITGPSAPKPKNYATLEKFWEKAIQTLGCMRGVAPLRDPVSGRPFVKLPDSPGFHTIPRHGHEFEGFSVDMDDAAVALQTLENIIQLLESVGTDISLVFETTTVKLTSAEIPAYIQRVNALLGCYQFFISGNYHADFIWPPEKPEFPPEGYWYFPLAEVSFSAEDSIRVYLIATPTGSFLEFVGASRLELESGLASTEYGPKLEFWEGPAHKRWGLDQLKFARFDLIRPKAAMVHQEAGEGGDDKATREK